MVSGDLKQYVSDVVHGEALYKSVTSTIKLGGLEVSKAYIPIDLLLPGSLPISKAILELAVRSRRERFTWRLKVNGVPVTREFKPNSTASTEHYLFSKLVYDITPIMQAREGRRRHRCNLLVRYEGSDELYIDHIGLLVYIDSEDARSHVSLVSGALALEPGENFAYMHKHPTGLSIPGALRLFFYSPSTYAGLRVRFNERFEEVFTSIHGSSEESLEVDEIGGENRVEIKHLEAEELYKPREILVSSLLLQQIMYREPKLVVKESLIPEKMSSGDRIKLVIANEGKAKPDKALLSIIHLGTTIYRKELPLLEPGEETVVEAPVKLPKGEHPLVVRLIWRKLSRTNFIDTKTRVTIV